MNRFNPLAALPSVVCCTWLRISGAGVKCPLPTQKVQVRITPLDGSFPFSVSLVQVYWFCHCFLNPASVAKQGAAQTDAKCEVKEKKFDSERIYLQHHCTGFNRDVKYGLRDFSHYETGSACAQSIRQREAWSQYCRSSDVLSVLSVSVLTPKREKKNESTEW